MQHRASAVAALICLLSATAAAQEPAPVTLLPTSDVPADAQAQPQPSAAEPLDQLTPQELQALGLDSAEPAVDRSLQLSGFADVGFSTYLGPRDSIWRASGAQPAHPSFYVGNLNVYLQKNLTDALRMMLEVRFTFLPNGSSNYNFDPRVDTTTSDYTEFGRNSRWGSIIIQRAYAEWQPSNLFAVRAGQYLTPFGVWNVDHGSPTIIPIQRPWCLATGWMPVSQTGLEVFGSETLSADNLIGYHLTLSNGTGPLSEYADLDDNKALGGRLYWENQGLGRLRVGASGYYGRYTNSASQITLQGTNVSASERVQSQYDMLTFAGDLTWKVGELHLQAELLVNQAAYTERGRALQSSISRAVVPADSISWGGYALLGYRLPWFGIMPFVLLEHVSTEYFYMHIDLTNVQVGLNIRPVDELVIKLAYLHISRPLSFLDEVSNLAVQIAWAF